MGVGQPCVDRPHRHLNCKAGKEGEEHQCLHPADDLDAQKLKAFGAEVVGQQADFAAADASGARFGKHRYHRHQHQHRAEEGIEEELEARVDTLFPAPDADDQEHRDQTRLKEEVKEHQIQRHEHAEHQRFQEQEGDHVFLDAVLDVPACRDDQRHHEGREHHEEDRDTVNAEAVF